MNKPLNALLSGLLFSSLVSPMIVLTSFVSVAEAEEHNRDPAGLRSSSKSEPMTGEDSSPVIIPVIPPRSEVPNVQENVNEGNANEESANEDNALTPENAAEFETDVPLPPQSPIEPASPIEPISTDITPDVVLLGQPDNAPFVVVIPGSREERLDRLQQIVPNAFLTDSRRGRYIQAGAFSSRSDAESLSSFLRHQGFDARVVYFRSR